MPYPFANTITRSPMHSPITDLSLPRRVYISFWRDARIESKHKRVEILDDVCATKMKEGSVSVIIGSVYCFGWASGSTDTLRGARGEILA